VRAIEQRAPVVLHTLLPIPPAAPGLAPNSDRVCAPNHLKKKRGHPQRRTPRLPAHGRASGRRRRKKTLIINVETRQVAATHDTIRSDDQFPAPPSPALLRFGSSPRLRSITPLIHFRSGSRQTDHEIKARRVRTIVKGERWGARSTAFGCRFHPCCPKAMPKSTSVEPMLTDPPARLRASGDWLETGPNRIPPAAPNSSNIGLVEPQTGLRCAQSPLDSPRYLTGVPLRNAWVGFKSLLRLFSVRPGHVHDPQAWACRLTIGADPHVAHE